MEQHFVGLDVSEAETAVCVVPPAEAEARYYEQLSDMAMVA